MENNPSPMAVPLSQGPTVQRSALTVAWLKSRPLSMRSAVMDSPPKTMSAVPSRSPAKRRLEAVAAANEAGEEIDTGPEHVTDGPDLSHLQADPDAVFILIGHGPAGVDLGDQPRPPPLLEVTLEGAVPFVRLGAAGRAHDAGPAEHHYQDQLFHDYLRIGTPRTHHRDWVPAGILS